MRHPRFACLVLVTALVGLTGVLSDPAPGQTPQVAPVSPAATPPPAGYGGYTLYGRPMPGPPMDEMSLKENELERQSQELARKYGSAQNRDDKNKLRDQLNEVLQKQFDAQQQRRKKEIDRIEERLKSLRELLQKREDRKGSIVQRRLEQMIEEAEGLGWTTTEPGRVLPSMRPSTTVPALPAKPNGFEHP
jgi:hypothetical protein